MTALFRKDAGNGGVAPSPVDYEAIVAVAAGLVCVSVCVCVCGQAFERGCCVRVCARARMLPRAPRRHLFSVMRMWRKVSVLAGI